MSLDSILRNLLNVPSNALAERPLVWASHTYTPACTTHLLFCDSNVVGKVGAFDQGPGQVHWFYQVDLAKQGVWIGPYETAIAAKLDCEMDVMKGLDNA